MNIKLSDHFTYRRLIRFVIPSIIMMVITSVYSIVDGAFVSNFVGKTSFAAVNLIMPVLMAAGTIGFLIGTGGSAVVAKTLGLGKNDKANEYFSMLVKSVIVIGIIVSVPVFIFMPQITKLLGASDALYTDCIIYGRILIAGNVFFMLQNCFQSFLVVAEKPTFGLVISICTGLCNMLLDFIFMYYFRMGIVGAGLATVIAQVIGGIIPLIYFLRKNSSRLKIVHSRFNKRIFINTCTNGSSEMVSNLSMSLVSMFYNLQLMKFSGENGIAAYGVIMYVGFIFAAVFIGYSIGSSPLVSYNYGAENHVELKNLFKKSIIIIMVLSVVMLVSSELFCPAFSSIFVGYDKELLDFTVVAFRIYSVKYIFLGINIFSSAFFTALNNGRISAIISFLRAFVFQTIAVFLLPVFFKTDGIWMSAVFSEVISLCVSMYYFITQKNKYHYM